MKMNVFKDIEKAEIDNLNLQWSALDINQRLLNVIKSEYGFEKMTPVQAVSIPLMLKNKDVIVQAKTGSGKTLAFVIPLLNFIMKLNNDKPIDTHDVLALILSPTRELASQIHREIMKLARKTFLDDSGSKRIVCHLMVGGSSVSTDINKYIKYGGNVIVACPGRISTIMEMTDNKLSSSIRKKLAFLILDEADQLLSFGFERNLSSILAYLPKQRRTSLFSATQTSALEDLVKSGLRDPIIVNVDKLNVKRNQKTDCDTKRILLMPERLSNYFYVCSSYAHKLALLASIIKTRKYKKILVFFSTSYQIDYFEFCLKTMTNEMEIPLLKLHRRLKSKRKAVYNKFKSNDICILLVTDILSRGIDVPDISCVVHLDLPTSPECYVHRSGRSGHQIEMSGISLMLLEQHELDYVEMCRRRQIALHEMQFDDIEQDLNLQSSNLSQRLRKHALKDKDFRTLGIQAFVAYIRFYSSKLCIRQLLFPKLDVPKLARSFGLIRLPKMPELRKNFVALERDFMAKSKDEATNSESIVEAPELSGTVSEQGATS